MPIRPVPREVDLSLSAFRERYAERSLPVVVEGSISHWPALQWGGDELDRLCGEQPLTPECPGDPTGTENVKFHSLGARGITWGSLLDVPSSDALLTLSDLLHAQRNASWALPPFQAGDAKRRRGSRNAVRTAAGALYHNVRGPDLYLHDAPIDVICPALLDAIDVPRYFPVDYQLQVGAFWRRPTHRCAA
eukprot:4340067-Prymnesium_polylepis.1